MIAVVAAIGYWVTNRDVQERSPDPSQTAGPSHKDEPSHNTEPSHTDKLNEPSRVDTETRSILEGRAHIDRSGGSSETMLVTVYYGDLLKNGESLQPVQIQVPDTLAILQVISEQIVNPPTELKLSSGVPAGIQVQSTNFDPNTGVATVDLSPEAGEVQGSAAATLLQWAFVYSLTEVRDVESVQLWINGYPAVLHGIEWSQPIGRNDLGGDIFKVEPMVRYGAHS